MCLLLDLMDTDILPAESILKLVDILSLFVKNVSGIIDVSFQFALKLSGVPRAQLNFCYMTILCFWFVRFRGLMNFHWYWDVLSFMQSGCCKPSNDCGFTYHSPTNWTKGNATHTNPDCDTWNNDPNLLCYNCQSCKAGLLQNLKTDWKKVAVVNIIFLVFLIIVYSVGCCAFRNNRRGNWKRY